MVAFQRDPHDVYRGCGVEITDQTTDRLSQLRPPCQRDLCDVYRGRGLELQQQHVTGVLLPREVRQLQLVLSPS